MQKTWILVADSSRARFFEMIDRSEDLREIDDLVNPAGRQHALDLRTDNVGRYYGRGEQMQGHAAPPRTDPVTHEVELFAKTVGHYLEQARVEHRYERLCLICAPKFLGQVRENLTKDTRSLVTGALDKDISRLDTRQVQQYVKEKLSPERG
jgi:protein required for attachment to host cells